MASTTEAQDFPSYPSEGQDLESLLHEVLPRANLLLASQTATSTEVSNGESITHSPYQQQPHASGSQRPVSLMLHSQRRKNNTDIILRALMRSRHHLQLSILQHYSSKP